MKHQERDYLSRKEENRNTWADNYVTQLPNYAAKLGVTTDQVKAVNKAYVAEHSKGAS